MRSVCGRFFGQRSKHGGPDSFPEGLVTRLGAVEDGVCWIDEQVIVDELCATSQRGLDLVCNRQLPRAREAVDVY